MNKKIIIIFVIVILILGNIFFGVFYFLQNSELKQIKKQLSAQQTNQKIIVFAKLFVDKVLLGRGTVSFDDRLKLENAVRDINDKEIFSRWQEFTDSKNDQDAQKAVGNLFKVLFTKACN